MIVFVNIIQILISYNVISFSHWFPGAPVSGVPDSLTREEGSVDPNTKHPCQTVPPGLPDTPYLSEIPPFLGASTPQFQIGLLINFACP